MTDAGLLKLNALTKAECRQALYACCSSMTWADQMVERRPFASEAHLLETANLVWSQCKPPDWLEAFSHHPRIGGNVQGLRDRFAGNEQKGVQGASEATLQALSQGNIEYEKKFGFVFLICATGKSADEMLASLTDRLHHTHAVELENARIEQGKITQIRLKKLLDEMRK